MASTTSNAPSGHVWELRYQAGTSNKFYRVYVIETDEAAFLVTNWGRWGTTGQFNVNRFRVGDAATSVGLDKRDKVIRKGYEQIRNQALPVVPQDILDRIEQSEGNVRFNKPATAPTTTTGTPVTSVSIFDQFAADSDRLIRMVTSSPDLTPEAVVLRSTLQEQLDELRSRVAQSEGALELVNDVITMKMGA